MTFNVSITKETKTSFLAQIPELPGVEACDKTRKQARSKAVTAALRAVANMIENGNVTVKLPIAISFVRKP